jgi:hypothetical protein
MDLQEIGRKGLHRPQVVKVQLSGCCKQGNEHKDSIKWGNFLPSCETAGFSRTALQELVSQYDCKQ